MNKALVHYTLMFHGRVLILVAKNFGRICKFVSVLCFMVFPKLYTLFALETTIKWGRNNQKKGKQNIEYIKTLPICILERT